MDRAKLVDEGPLGYVGGEKHGGRPPKIKL